MRILLVIAMTACTAAPQPAETASADAVLGAEHLSARADELAQRFPATANGRAWSLFATLGRRSSDDARRVSIAQLVALAADAHGALADLDASIDGLEPSDRQLLMQMAARLPLPVDERVAFLQKQLARPAADGAALFDGAIAVDLLADILPRDRLEPLVAAAMAAQPSETARAIFASRLAARR
jgi:hypothetical protein